MAVQPNARAADDVELGFVVPGLEVVILVDEDPDVLVPALHLPLRPDESDRHSSAPAARRIARSIFG